VINKNVLLQSLANFPTVRKLNRNKDRNFLSIFNKQRNLFRFQNAHVDAKIENANYYVLLASWRCQYSVTFLKLAF